MKIVIHEDPLLEETEIVINCRSADTEVLRLLASLRAYEKKLTGLKDGKTYLLESSQVFYIDTVDKRTFLYTRSAVYETPLRLYELEERLAANDFFRASKSCVINLRAIRSLAPDFGGRLEVTLENGERLSISRQYAAAIKIRLGL